MAEEAGAFDFGDVVAGIAEKLERRHPHVFGERRELGVAEQSRLWEEIKRDERDRRRPGNDATVDPRDPAASGVLADVPVGLPGLSRAAKLGKRAAAVGFDWPDVAGVRAKVSEELGELDAALAGRRPNRRSPPKSATCCSRSRTCAGTSSSTPKRACAARTRASRSGSRTSSSAFEPRAAIGPRTIRSSSIDFGARPNPRRAERAFDRAIRRNSSGRTDAASRRILARMLHHELNTPEEE